MPTLLLSKACSLFVVFSALASFVFNRLQPLFAKHPGGVLPLLQFPLLPQRPASTAAPPRRIQVLPCANPLLKKQLRKLVRILGKHRLKDGGCQALAFSHVREGGL